MIRLVWNRYNVSTVMVLPLLKDIFKNIISIDKKHYLSIYDILHRGGFINSFLYYKGEYNNTIKLSFKRDKILGNLNVSGQCFNIFNLLFNCKQFKDIKILEKEVIIFLEIDNIWKNDIIKIEESNYSSTSLNFKKYVTTDKNKKYLSSGDKLIDFMSNTLCGSIVYKDVDLLKEIQSLLKINYKIEGEYFIEFNKKLENII